MARKALLAALLALGWAPAAHAQVRYGDDTAAAPSVPPVEALYGTGVQGKRLLGGTWSFRRDGETAWRPVGVPYVWNSDDLSLQSMLGGVGWFRKDFVLPSDRSAKAWALRFEAANYTLTAWLNGKPIGTHSGAYLPFELPATGARAGVNRLLVKVDSRTTPFDLPPGGLDAKGNPDGGWWNYGGLPREVYLRPVQALDLDDVLVRSSVGCPTCAATMRVAATVRNTTAVERAVAVDGTAAGRALRFAGGPATLAPGASATYSARLRVANPKLWAPGDPHLYRVAVTARDGRGAAVSDVEEHGIRHVELRPDGRLEFNWKPLALRGASMHEDDPVVGNALSPARRRADIDALLKLGATFTRAHYPLHPQTLELADRFGIAVWDEAPIYQLTPAQLLDAGLQQRAETFVRAQVLRDRNHPSVLAWSLGNELPARLDAPSSRLIARLAAAARELDPTRLVALDVLGYPGVPAQSAYDVLDAIGINDYFGWYDGPGGATADRAGLGRYLDSMRALYPGKALFVTEFGAEADHDGPVTEKGTYAFQAQLLHDHLAAIDARPWLGGALAWILRDFRVKPGFTGGNPNPAPPDSAKGLLAWDGQAKPAYAELRRLFRTIRGTSDPGAG
ncbi:MAG: beta-glucuronidase [Solirubrobacteraceae bacterium]|nr:beta-glucuronidase [Solirubrobacteraceae bacterium]